MTALLALLFTGCDAFCKQRCDLDDDGYPHEVDCNDRDSSINPGQPELAFDGKDNDCDASTTDEDPDGDGATWRDCAPYDATVHPGAREVWYDGIDQDCLEDSDYDADRDGWDRAEDGGQDCDDAKPQVNPDAEEVCNGVDDDCSGVVDDGASDALTWYADADEDGYGDPEAPLDACEAPDGYVDDPGDCEDGDADVSPSAEELPGDDVDDDCDGCATLAGGVGQVLPSSGPLVLDTQVQRLREHASLVALVSLGEVWAGPWDQLALQGPGELVTTWGGELAWMEGEEVWGMTVDGAEDLQLLDEQLAVGRPQVGSEGQVLVLDVGAEHPSEGHVLAGKVAGDGVGHALAAGDVNGDGAVDLLIAAPLGGSSDKGRVYAVFGPVTATLALEDVKQQGGKDPDTRLGTTLAAGGDADGDGYDDVLAGTAEGHAQLIRGPMKVFSTDPQATLVGEGPVAFVGDADCDNRDDLVVGSSLYLAPFEGALTEPDAHWTTGSAVGVGDVDGDSYDDLLVAQEALYLLERGGL